MAEREAVGAEGGLLERHRSLRAKDYSKMIDGLDPAEVAALEAHVSRAAMEANAAPVIEDLARRLVVEKLRNGFPFADVVDEALHEANINSVGGSEEVPMGEAEKKVRDNLSLMLIAYNEPIYDPQRVMSFIQEIMEIRQVDESQRESARQELLSRLKSLENTDDRFLFPVLRDALKRAVKRPEISAWALTDSELVSVYQATGGSSDLLTEAGLAVTPLSMVPFLAPVLAPAAAAAGFAGYQQHRMQEAYARELRRRGFLALPNE